MRSRKTALCVCVAVIAPISAFAQENAAGLQWDQTTIRIENDGGAAVRHIDFGFRNAGNAPISIRSVSTSCGCTVTKADKKQYAPGERGTLQVSHKPKAGFGLRNYHINVRTDEAGGHAHELLLQVSNTPRIVVTPRVVTWEPGEAPKSKSVDVFLQKDETLKVVGAKAERDVLDVRVVDGEKPDCKVIVVTPQAGAPPGRVRVDVLTEPPLPHSMDARFFAVLR